MDVATSFEERAISHLGSDVFAATNLYFRAVCVRSVFPSSDLCALQCERYAFSFGRSEVIFLCCTRLHYLFPSIVYADTHTHTQAQTSTHARTHTHACNHSHARTHTSTHTHTDWLPPPAIKIHVAVACNPLATHHPAAVVRPAVGPAGSAGGLRRSAGRRSASRRTATWT